MGAAHIVIDFPPIAVRDGAHLAPRFREAISALWRSGRLTSLLETSEGRAAVSAFEAIRVDVEQQLARAMAFGAEEFSIHIELRADEAKLVVVFVRSLIGMLSDPATMAAVDGEPLTAADVAYLEPSIRYAEGAVAGL